MPRPVFDDNDENKVEAEVQVTRHGALGYMKEGKKKHVITGKLD
jgi:hypothetical protein